MAIDFLIAGFVLILAAGSLVAFFCGLGWIGWKIHKKGNENAKK